MLTRDISLTDAILDLVDNCLDGALRVADGCDVDYSSHRVRITCSADEFRIEDDCGGIPLDIAENYAFKMGREADDDRDSTTETIGMYGVGMKRAIFKMGREADVSSRHGSDAFMVRISSAWLENKDWTPLPIVDLEDGASPDTPGTIIRVRELFPGVARSFGNEGWVAGVRNAISEHFTTFLQRGLNVEVNGEAVRPTMVRVLYSDRQNAPVPFVFQERMGSVDVSVVVGLRSAALGEVDDLEEAPEEHVGHTAGWTIFCNDRAVIVGDKGRQ